MADKRIYQLGDASVLTGKYIIIDKSGSGGAERYLVTDLISQAVSSAINNIMRTKKVNVSAGANSITFTSAISGTYNLLTKLVTLSGDKSDGDVTNETATGFDFYAYDAGELTYVALIEA